MTITKRPRRTVAAKAEKAEGAEDFINAAPDAPVPVPEAETLAAEPAVKAEPDKGDKKVAKKDKKHKKKKIKKKEAVLIRFDNDQIKKIDDVAASLGLSRAAWVRMVVAQALPR